MNENSAKPSITQRYKQFRSTLYACCSVLALRRVLPRFLLALLVCGMFIVIVVQPVLEQNNKLSASQNCIESVNHAITGKSGFSCLPVTGKGVQMNEQRRFCQAQRVVEALVSRIELRQAVIDSRRQILQELTLRSAGFEWPARAWQELVYLSVWSYHQVRAVSDYWRIGSLESSLLIAYSRLRASKSVLPMDCLSSNELMAAIRMGRAGKYYQRIQKDTDPVFRDYPFR